ncbi:MAG: EAL domain-containing protein [Nitrosomonadales bacterium]|nr:EAL domain-containing protein [Nitrosomonadales bacterium]
MRGRYEAPYSGARPTVSIKQFGAAVLLANLFVIALSGLSLRQSWLQYQEIATATTQNLSRVLVEEISGDIDKTDLALKICADEIERQVSLGYIDGQTLNTSLARQLPRLPELTGIWVSDAQGRIKYGTDTSASPLDVADQKYFAHQRDTANAGLWFDKPLLAARDKQWIVPISRRLNYPDGSFLGIIYANLSVNHIVETFSTLEIGAYGNASLIDRNLNILATRYPEPLSLARLIGKRLASQQLQQFILAGNNNGAYSDSSAPDLIERHYSFRKLEKFPLYIELGMAPDDYLAGWRAEAGKTAALAAIFLFSTLALTWFVYRSWNRQRSAYDSLQNSEERFQNMLAYAPIGMSIISLGGRFMQVNYALCQILGYDKYELMQLTASEITHPDDLASHAKHAKQLLDGEVGSYQIESRFIRKDGQAVWTQFTVSLLRGNVDNPMQFMAEIENITSRKYAEEQLKLSAKVFESGGECIIITDSNERILMVNKAFTAVTGYSPEEVIGQTPRMMSSGRHAANFYRKIWQALQSTGHWQGEIWNKRKNGDIYPEWLSMSAVKNAAGQITNYIGISSDITERKAAEAQIEFLAYHDALTGLPNRRLAIDHIVLAFAYADRAKTKAALLLLDLDNFKTINDSFGHGVGDDLLKAVSRCLCSCVPDTDTVSRQGGDEFLILLTNVNDNDSITNVTEKILASLEETFLIAGQEISTSLSIGIAVYPDDSKDVNTLLKFADKAMCHAKEAGKNTYQFYTEQMNIDAVENQRIRVGLRRAIERDEFVLYYQPQIDLSSGAVVGAEALIRWNHPELGLVAPGRFIPVAEESGLIVPMGDWVLREACRQAAAWRKAGLPELLMAVNISAMQFKRGGLEQSVMAALDESGLPPTCLELELTESIMIQNPETVLETVRRLKSLGIMFSIDDFGTGYSSLSYLKRFSVDKLKIDQSFVRDMLNNPNDAIIVRAIIQMARSLNLKTIAEGVENEHLAAFLRLQYCDEAQGYHFARPLPADEFAQYLSNTLITST